MSIVLELDRTRAGYIAGLRMLADLLEDNPDIPHNEYGSIGFALDCSEAEASAVIDRAAAALKAAGVPFSCRVTDYGYSIECVLAGVRYGFSRLRDSAVAEYEARHSYDENVQV